MLTDWSSLKLLFGWSKAVLSWQPFSKTESSDFFNFLNSAEILVKVAASILRWSTLQYGRPDRHNMFILADSYGQKSDNIQTSSDDVSWSTDNGEHVQGRSSHHVILH